MFRTSCSCFAVDVLTRHGWTRGIQLVAERLDRCGGNFTVSADLAGRVMMRTGDGATIPGDQLASWLLRGISAKPEG
ncbi:hypothetical protein [Acidisphaera sp. L21]|uniref:hypothetical protein n=1 Tax=Acidisphaera sp. L21 TaxID=1641851 RepID=UPI0038D12C45